MTTMGNEPLLQVTMRCRVVSRCVLPGTIIVPEFDAQGVLTGNGALVTPDKLAELDPAVWLVAGIDGFLVKRKQGEVDDAD